MVKSSSTKLRYALFSRLFILICFALICTYIVFLAMDISRQHNSGEMGEDEQEQIVAEETSEKGTNIRILTGTVATNPDSANYEYRIETDEGEKISIAMKSVNLEEWVGKRVRAVFEYEDDGVHFTITDWREE